MSGVTLRLEKFGFFFAGSNYEWPRGSISAGMRVLKNLGGEVVGDEYLDFGVTDYSDLLDHLEKSGADVFVPYFAGSDQILLLTQFAEASLKDHMAVVMGHFDEAMLSRLPAEIGSGFYSCNTYFMSIQSDENKRYLGRLSKRKEITGIWPRGNGILTNFGEGVFLCVKAFARAVNRAGSTEADAIVEQLEEVAVCGPQGRVVMDKETHHAAVNSYIARSNAQGTFDLIERFGLIEPEIPHRYRRQFSNHKKQKKSVEDKRVVEPSENDFGSQWRMLGIIGCQDITFSALTRPSQEVADTSAATGFKTLTGDVDAPLLAYLNSIYDYIVNNLVGHHVVFVPAPGFVLKRYNAESIRLSPLISQNSQLQLAVCVGRKQNLLQETELIELTDTAIISVDVAGKITQTNGMVYRLFGYNPQELIGQPLDLLIPPHLRTSHRELVNKFANGTVRQKLMASRNPITGYRKDGSEFPAEASITKLSIPGGVMLVAAVRDISDRKNIQETLVWLACHDQLTRLANRSLINERLENALARSRRSGEELALLFVDIDNFKDINDTFGHSIGDRVLIEIAGRLIKSVRPGDTVGRFGGDEFLILCDHIESREDVPAIIARVIESMKMPFHIADAKAASQGVFVTVSIGVAYGDGDSDSPGTLIKNADMAMYSAKQQGRDRWVNYENSMEANTRRFLTIANGLRTAIENNEFHVVLQPIVEAGNGRLSGAEVLIRWHHNGTNISPSIFIPIAEATGAVQAIGDWVLEQACRLANSWSDYFREGYIQYLSINISARQITYNNFVHKVTDMFRKSQIAPENLVLEVTETAIMMDEERGMKILRELGNLGFKFAIDDFGTGYSSLGKLIALPVNNLKIDRVFAQNFGIDKKAEKLVEAIIGIAHALDLKVIVEGVENSNQLDIMKALGCDYIQGYYFSEPILPEAFEQKYFAS